MLKDILSIFVLFLSGIGLNLTPCVYPLFPITISYFGGKSSYIKGKPYIHGIIYVFGIAITNSILALIATFTGSMLGSTLQNPLVIVGISIFLLYLAFSLFGIWEIKIPYQINKLLTKRFSGYKSTFFIGLMFGIFAAPCAGPFVIAVMTYVAKNANPVTGFIYFLSLSLGMGLPMGILAVFSGMINKLPSSGEWMLWVKKLFAWTLVFMALYFLKPIVKQSIIYKYILGMVCLTSAFHISILDKTLGKKLGLIKKLFGIVLFCIAIYLFYFSYFCNYKNKVKWLSYNEHIFNDAKIKNKFIILDFYADWCLSCRHVEKLFYEPEIAKLSKKFIMIKVDLTQQMPFQKNLLKDFNIKGLPTLIIITPTKRFRLEGEIKKQKLIETIKKAFY